MRTIRIAILGLCCIILTSLINPLLYAQITHVFSFHKNTNTETLSISLEQYQVDKNGKRAVAQSTSVLPGEEVSYIPVIKNNGADCYVRLRITIEMKDRDIQRRISLDDIYGIGSCWKQIGDYLYCTQVLRSGASLDAFEGIEIPYIWTQKRHESSGFTLHAFADAIQSDNYTPNFNSNSPWDDGVEKFRTGANHSMPGGRDVVQTGDDNMLKCWMGLLICMTAVAVYSSWNRRR